MPKFTATYDGYHINPDGSITAKFRATSNEKASLVSTIRDIEIWAQNANNGVIRLDVTVEKHRKKRSLDANAYAWELMGQLAKKLRVQAVDIYREYVKDLNIKRTVKIDKTSAKTLIRVWQEKGLAWIAEKVDEGDEFAIVDLYYGSSVYDTKQMSQLIELIVNDCKLQGIETKTPEELAQLKGLTRRENNEQALSEN